MQKQILIALACFSISSVSWAGPDDFQTGPVFTDFGHVASVKSDMKIPEDASFKILFDSAKAAYAGEVNKTLNSAARFMNMHGRAGVSEDNMKIAIVVHADASTDLTRQSYYGDKFKGAQNANTKIIKAMTDKGVRVILCGQSAAYRNIENEDLLPGVEMALSAMTAHALLQQDGYTLNPF